MNRAAFTLIELLITIAIILVLIAIALPNLMEAQIRARLTRCQSDLRTLATAIEAYHAEQNRLPPTAGPFSPSLFRRLRPLTTPIAYLTELPKDPFQPLQQPFWDSPSILSDQEPRELWDGYYLYNLGDAGVGSSHGGANAWLRSAWSLTAAGPDQTIAFPYYYFAPPFQGHHWVFVYSPTNGTRSSGEVFRRGGSFPTH